MSKNIEEEFQRRGYLVTEKVLNSSDQVIYYDVLIADLELLGLVDITLSYSCKDGHASYNVSKYGVPFYMNDCESLKKCISFFFGSPFSLSINKIQGINFARYSIDIVGDNYENAQDFFVSLGLLQDILINIDKHTTYD